MELKRRALSAKSQHHLQALAALAARADLSGWTFGTFQKLLGRARVYGIGVFDKNDNLYGYLIYDSTSPRCLTVLSLVVDPKMRLFGIGSGLLNYLKNTMREIGETDQIRVVLNEEDLDAQKFLRSFGKKTGDMSLRTSVARNKPRDHYVFVFQDQEKEACVK